MIAQNIQDATHTCFSAAQKRVYSLMENNSYPRFLESEFYQELCKKAPISRAAQGTWAMERREKQPLGWWGSQATAHEQHPDPKGWGTERSVCLPRCEDKSWLWCRLTAQSGAVGGRSGEMVEACEPAAGTALPCQCCSERWLCVRPKRAVQEPFCHGPGAMRQVRTELPSCEQELLSALGQCWELE